MTREAVRVEGVVSDCCLASVWATATLFGDVFFCGSCLCTCKTIECEKEET